jgi:hypothetical protein
MSPNRDAQADPQIQKSPLSQLVPDFRQRARRAQCEPTEGKYVQNLSSAVDAWVENLGEPLSFAIAPPGVVNLSMPACGSAVSRELRQP